MEIHTQKNLIHLLKLHLQKSKMKKLLSILIVVLIISSCGDNKKYNDTKEGIRIVSLAPSLTRELVDLGLTDNIVGATSYCDITKDNEELIIGSAMTVSIEKILLLKPDIVFASGLTKSKTVETLRNNGVKVRQFGKMTSFDKICSYFLEMGKLVDRESVADSIIKKSRIKIDSLINSIPKHTDSLTVLMQIGAKPIFVVTPNSFMADYISFSGCKNVMGDLTSATITREAVLERNPDVIFVITMGIVGDNEKATWTSYSEISASKENRVFIIDYSIASTPTVLSFTEALEIIINKIYQK